MLSSFALDSGLVRFYLLLKWHGARLSFLALFLIALFRVKTVNLVDLSIGFKSQAKQESSYKRLQRFLREFDLDYYSMAKLVIEMMEIPQPWVLSLDRTEWQFGCQVFNILTLGIVYQGVAFPLLWWMLDKKGNSNTNGKHQLSTRIVFSHLQIGQKSLLKRKRILWGHQVYIAFSATVSITYALFS